jgi:transposase
MDAQKKTVVADERMTPRIQEWRRQFAKFQQAADPLKLWFIDEAGCHISMTRDRARAPRGERAVDTAPRNRGTVVSMVGSLSIDGMGPMMTIEGGTSGDVFLMYVERCLAPVLQPGDIVVLDNVGAHRDNRVRAAVEATGARLKFQPAYSPDLNPIELAWSKLKAILKGAKARTHEALNRAIVQAIELIDFHDDAPAWFRCCGWSDGRDH